MAIVAEDVKKIMAEEFLLYQVYMKANEERIIEKEKESPLLRGPNLAPKQCPLTLLQSSLISVWTYAHEGFLCGTAYVCVRRHVRL